MRKSVTQTSRTASCSPIFMHANRTFRKNANRAGKMLSSFHRADRSELAWRDINQMSWDYTNAVTDKKQRFPHQGQ